MRGLRRGADIPFFAAFIALSGSYALLIVGMLAADLSFASASDLAKAFQSREIRYSIALSLVSCTLSALLSMLAAVPAGYLLSRFQFRGKSLAEGLFDIPIALPPLVVGVSLLILFQTPPGDFLEKIAAGAARYTGFNSLMRWIGAPEVKGVAYETPAVILAQFTVAAAFAVRAMRVSFDQIDPRQEQVALTLGCGRGQAFFRVALPQARPGLLAAFTLAWARSMGEFGPVLVFAGATRMKTEVLPTTVFLELSVGNLEAAVSVSFVMIAAAFLALWLARSIGQAHD